jgi:hypothetical protein
MEVDISSSLRDTRLNSVTSQQTVIFWKCTGFSIRCKVYRWLFIMDSHEQNPTSGQQPATQTLNKQGATKQRTLSGVIHLHCVLSGQARSHGWLRSASTVQSAAPHVLETGSRGTECSEIHFNKWNLLRIFSHSFLKQCVVTNVIMFSTRVK